MCVHVLESSRWVTNGLLKVMFLLRCVNMFDIPQKSPKRLPYVFPFRMAGKSKVVPVSGKLVVDRCV